MLETYHKDMLEKLPHGGNLIQAVGLFYIRLFQDMVSQDRLLSGSILFKAFFNS
jgi:hypothetical protein